MLDSKKFSSKLLSCSFSRPTPVLLTEQSRPPVSKKPQPPLPSSPAVWVHTAVGASLPPCSQRHTAACKPGAGRLLASSHPAGSPGTVPGPRTHTSVTKFRFYSASSHNGTWEHSSVQHSSGTSLTKERYSTGLLSCLRPAACVQWCFVATAMHSTADAHICLWEVSLSGKKFLLLPSSKISSRQEKLT